LLLGASEACRNGQPPALTPPDPRFHALDPSLPPAAAPLSTGRACALHNPPVESSSKLLAASEACGQRTTPVTSQPSRNAPQRHPRTGLSDLEIVFDSEPIKGARKNRLPKPRDSAFHEPLVAAKWVIFWTADQPVAHGIGVDVVEPRKVSSFVGQTSIPVVAPDTPPGSPIKRVDEAACNGVKGADQIRQGIGVVGSTRDDMVMIRENGPRLKPPTQKARAFEKRATEVGSLLWPVQQVLITVDGPRNHVACPRTKEMRRGMWVLFVDCFVHAFPLRHAARKPN